VARYCDADIRVFQRLNQHSRATVRTVRLAGFEDDIFRITVMGDPQRTAQAGDLVLKRAWDSDDGPLVQAVYAAVRGGPHRAIGAQISGAREQPSDGGGERDVRVEDGAHAWLHASVTLEQLSAAPGTRDSVSITV